MASLLVTYSEPRGHMLGKCTLCSRQWNCQDQFEDHIQGKMHRNRMRSFYQRRIGAVHCDMKHICLPGVGLVQPGDKGIAGFECTECGEYFSDMFKAFNHNKEACIIRRTWEARNSEDLKRSLTQQLGCFGNCSSSEQCFFEGCGKQAFHSTRCDCGPSLGRAVYVCIDHIGCPWCGKLLTEAILDQEVICPYGQCYFGHICVQCEAEVDGNHAESI